MAVEGDMAARMMGIFAAGLILWVVFTTPQTSFAEEESSKTIFPPLPPSKTVGFKETPAKRVLENKVCSPSSSQGSLCGRVP